MALWGYLSAQIVREEWVLSLWLYEYTNIYKYIAIYDIEGGTTSLASDGAAQQVAKIAKNVRGKQSKNNCNPLTSVCVWQPCGALTPESGAVPEGRTLWFRAWEVPRESKTSWNR